MMKFETITRQNRYTRPFHFEATWLTHKDCNGIIKEAWEPFDHLFPIQQAAFQVTLKDWNKKTFGHIFKRNKMLREELNKLDKKLDRGWNQQLFISQKDIWKQYEEVLAQEEILWYKKSRTQWLEFGDRNTCYFHEVATIRRRRNHISSLQNEASFWVNNPNDLEQMATAYYVNLFIGDEVFLPFPLSKDSLD